MRMVRRSNLFKAITLTTAQTKMERRTLIVEHSIPEERKKNIWVMEKGRRRDILHVLHFVYFAFFKILLMV